MGRSRLESHLNSVKIWPANIPPPLVKTSKKKSDFLPAIVMDLYFPKFKYRLVVIFNKLTPQKLDKRPLHRHILKFFFCFNLSTCIGYKMILSTIWY